jgi:hypothetical protein
MAERKEGVDPSRRVGSLAQSQQSKCSLSSYVTVEWAIELHNIWLAWMLVAGDLGISEITVTAHRGKVMRKMMATSLPDLARTVDKIGLNPFILA